MQTAVCRSMVLGAIVLSLSKGAYSQPAQHFEVASIRPSGWHRMPAQASTCSKAERSGS